MLDAIALIFSLCLSYSFFAVNDLTVDIKVLTYTVSGIMLFYVKWNNFFKVSNNRTVISWLCCKLLNSH